MIPGTLCCDNEFVFSDGTKGKKILVILNDGEANPYIVIKTTSKSNHKGITYGCQSTDRYPNFYLPNGSCCLRGQTWVMLDQFFEFKSHEMLTKHFLGQMNRIGLLPDAQIKELLLCAIQCDDISVGQGQVLQNTLDSL
jgi:hypothetical protein